MHVLCMDQSGLSNFTRVTSDTHISLMKTTNVYSSLRSLQLLALHGCHFQAKLSLMRLQLSGTLMDKHEGREKRSYDERDTGSYCNAWKCHMSPSLTFHWPKQLAVHVQVQEIGEIQFYRGRTLMLIIATAFLPAKRQIELLSFTDIKIYINLYYL